MLTQPDFKLIQARSCKQFVVVVRRLIQHEKLFNLRAVHHIDRPDKLDIVLRGRFYVWIVRHFKGSTRAAMQRFPVNDFSMLTDVERPDPDEFLRAMIDSGDDVDVKVWYPKIS